MKNVLPALIAWLALAAHVVVFVIVRRRSTDVPVVAMLNLAVALCILAYWAQKWYSYIARDITWYVTDQLVPLYAIVVCVLAGVTLTTRLRLTVPHWVVFSIDTFVFVGAVLFFSFFRMTKLM